MPDARAVAELMRLHRPGVDLARATLTAPDVRVLADLFFDGQGHRLGALTIDGVVQLWDLGQLRRELGRLSLDWSSAP